MRLKRFTDSVTGINRSAISISFRLLIFNLLLVFLPVAAVLYLDVYEGQLLTAQEKSMVQQGRLLSAALGEQGVIEKEKVDTILVNLRSKTETRLRVVDSKGWLLADSSTIFLPDIKKSTVSIPRMLLESGDSSDTGSIQSQGKTIINYDEDSLLYRLAIYPVRIYRKLFNPPYPLEEGHYYSSTSPFRGKEIEAALLGRYGAVTRLSSGGQKSVTLYIAIPVISDDTVVGAVLCSQSTYRILKDLYEIRLFILKIFLASIIAAVVISLFLSRTISHRIKRLSREAKAITTGRGRIKGSFTPLRLNDEIGYLSRSLKDLTDRLDRHIQFIDSFSRDISHEFKNPLAVVKSASEMISQSQGKQQERFVELIDQNTKRMESLLNGIEEISRLDSHLDKEKKERVDPSTLIRNLLDGFELRYPDRRWIFEDIPGKRITLWVSPERMSQVFVNIYENAFSFSPLQGIIRTSLSIKNNQIEISIYNEGSSIPEDDLEKIFNRFYTSREEKDGNHHGLGLSIVKAVINSYGGIVRAENTTGGVTFYIMLPFKK